jgi:hypothetical protein
MNFHVFFTSLKEKITRLWKFAIKKHHSHIELKPELLQIIVYKPLLLCELLYNGTFTLEVKSMLNENLGGILGGTQC